jgi:putative glycosyltransferase (TIGR04348 family)
VNIQLITPAPLAINNGNKITAVRWLRILRQLGHKVALSQSYDGKRYDLLIALHARRSYESIHRFHELHPRLPLLVVLTGTDLYRDIRSNPNAQHSLQLATRLVALQRMALAELPKQLHGKTRVIYQSAQPYHAKPPSWNSPRFRICVIAHLRHEKDPLRTALAVRRLPAKSRIEVLHIGRALDGKLEKRARIEAHNNPRYRWIGELPHWQARRLLARSHLAVITSRMEGSSNVLSEAITSSVPVIASKIPGLMGTLGRDFPGYFPLGDTRALAALLAKTESDHEFYSLLKKTCTRLSFVVKPEREVQAWRSLLKEL